MLKLLVGLPVIIFTLVNLLYAQDIRPEDKIKIERGNEIINLARKAVFKEIKKDDVKSIQIKKLSHGVTESIRQVEGYDALTTSTGIISENNLSIEFPAKIKTTNISYKPNANPVEDYTKIEMVSNGSEYGKGMDIIKGGKKLDLAGITAKLPSSISASIKGQMTNLTGEMNKTGQNADLGGLLPEVFPILLDAPWDPSLTFVHIGKAKAGVTRADIVEVKSISEKDQIRLFFDENTHLLLMMTVNSKAISENREDKYFFSNYESVGGLMIAKKISYESASANKEKLAVAGLPTLLGNSKKTTTEITIKEIKINPTFASDFFLVKKK